MIILPEFLRIISIAVILYPSLISTFVFIRLHTSNFGSENAMTPAIMKVMTVAIMKEWQCIC